MAGTIAERQAEAAEHDSLDGQFQRAVEMLGHEMVSVRVGGVVALHNLATRHFDRYGWQVCRILQAFMDARRKGASGVDERDAGHGMSRTVGGSYEGTLDGVQAFDAFWDIQEPRQVDRRKTTPESEMATVPTGKRLHQIVVGLDR